MVGCSFVQGVVKGEGGVVVAGLLLLNFSRPTICFHLFWFRAPNINKHFRLRIRLELRLRFYLYLFSYQFWIDFYNWFVLNCFNLVSFFRTFLANLVFFHYFLWALWPWVFSRISIYFGSSIYQYFAPGSRFCFKPLINNIWKFTLRTPISVRHRFLNKIGGASSRWRMILHRGLNFLALEIT